MLQKILQSPPFAPKRRWLRGFTLLELMTVVILIGILAVIAIPGALKSVRERRSSRAAQEIAALFNQARARSVARGSAVLVRYNYAANGFEVREAIAGTAGGGMGNCVLAPVSSCTVPATRWNAADPGNQVLTQFRPLNDTTYAMVDVQYMEYSTGSPNGSAQAAVDICMTPGGRVFYRASNAAGTPFQELTGNHAIRVWMHDGPQVIGIERQVYILPNGTARVGT